MNNAGGNHGRKLKYVNSSSGFKIQSKPKQKHMKLFDDNVYKDEDRFENVSLLSNDSLKNKYQVGADYQSIQLLPNINKRKKEGTM